MTNLNSNVVIILRKKLATYQNLRIVPLIPIDFSHILVRRRKGTNFFQGATARLFFKSTCMLLLAAIPIRLMPGLADPLFMRISPSQMMMYVGQGHLVQDRSSLG